MYTDPGKTDAHYCFLKIYNIYCAHTQGKWVPSVTVTMSSLILLYPKSSEVQTKFQINVKIPVRTKHAASKKYRNSIKIPLYSKLKHLWY